MLEAEESCQTVNFMTVSRESCQAINFAIVSRVGPTREAPMKLFAWSILGVTFLPFIHTIYTLITHKSMRGYSKRKILDRFFTTQHTHLLERERATHL